MLKRSIGGLIVAMAMFVGANAFAQATLAVSATVDQACSIVNAAGVLTFSNFSGSEIPYEAADTNITVTCLANESVTVTFDGGIAPVGGVRQMQSGASRLLYYLASTAADADYWVPTVSQEVPATAGATTTIPIYGRIPAAQPGLTLTGAHTDTVAVTITF